MGSGQGHSDGTNVTVTTLGMTATGNEIPGRGLRTRGSKSVCASGDHLGADTVS